MDQFPSPFDNQLPQLNTAEPLISFDKLLAYYKARVYEAYSWALLHEWNQSAESTHELED